MTKEEELFKAAEEGNVKKVKSLLNPKLFGVIKPVDVNITGEDGWSLLMAAAAILMLIGLLIKKFLFF